MLPDVQDSYWPVRRTCLTVPGSSGGDDWHRTMTSGPNRLLGIRTAGAESYSNQSITSLIPDAYSTTLRLGFTGAFLERPHRHRHYPGVRQCGPLLSPKKGRIEGER
jgi:hypothetical protein